MSMYVSGVLYAGLTCALIWLAAVPDSHARHMVAYVSNPLGSSVPGCEDMATGCFIPSTVTIDAGSTVIWTNDDGAAHTVTGGSTTTGPDGTFDSGLFMPETSVAFRFEEAGVYPYYCMLHPWQTGTVVVTEPDGAPYGKTTLSLNPLPYIVEEGQHVTFSGRLATQSGVAVPYAAIYIKDDVAWGTDTVVRVLYTDADGRFTYVWVATERAGGAYDFYAIYDGSATTEDSRSPTRSVYVMPATDAQSAVILDPVPSVVYAGDTVTFTGRLTGGGLPLPDRTIHIMEDDPLVPDQFIGSARTDADGRFAVVWVAEAGLLETDFDMYAEFDGDGRHPKAQSPRLEMSIFKRSGSITLNMPQSSAAYGEVVTFTGTLRLDDRNPEGVIVYIMDEDSLGFDDMLAAAWVDASGRYSTYWIADDIDFDGVADVYAVYEGDWRHERLATCDLWCSDTIKIRTYNGTMPAPPAPSTDRYMELYYTLDFEEPPLVLVIPSPDAYEEVRRHIIPVQEGIVRLQAMLEAAYPGGNWNVDFEVHESGRQHAKEPDIIMRLATVDDDAKCGRDYAGWAKPTGQKPIQTLVCSLDRPDERIGSTAAHEFIHAMGIGHTFNMEGDMMCSSENGIPTCTNLNNRSARPSGMNLAAIVKVYGADGFQNPNNPDISYKERFTIRDYENLVHLDPFPGTWYVPDDGDAAYPGWQGYEVSHSGSLYTDWEWYERGETILFDGFYWEEFDGPSGILILDPFGDVADDIPVYVADDFFSAQAYVHDRYISGTYTAVLYDDAGLYVTETLFDIVEIHTGVLYTDWEWYERGEAILFDGFYWEEFDGPSGILILDPFGDVADDIPVYVADDFFSAQAYVHDRYISGTYTAVLYDDAGLYVTETTFYIVD